MSYTVKIVTGCRIVKKVKVKNWKNWCQCLKKNHVFSSSPPSPPGLLLPGCWPPTASPPLGPWAHPWDVKHGAPEHSSFSGGLVVGGTSIVVVDYCPLLLKALPSLMKKKKKLSSQIPSSSSWRKNYKTMVELEDVENEIDEEYKARRLKEEKKAIGTIKRNPKPKN